MWFVALLRWAFDLLYHPLAWAYDGIAWLVSLGRWQEWGKTALPHMRGRVLELGSGPGHLQVAMGRRGWLAFGLDESRQMVTMAGRRLRRAGLPLRMVRARAQALPYPDSSFDTVVATFPSDYILEREMLGEVWRVLSPTGMLVVVPMVWFTGTQCVYGWLRRLFEWTGQSQAIEVVWPRLATRLESLGFRARYELVEMDVSRVLVVLAEKQERRAEA